MICLRPLLAELDWVDASTETEQRLTARGGNLGLIANENGSLTLVTIDANTQDPINLTITGGWSYGMVKVIIMNLMTIDTIRGGYKS